MLLTARILAGLIAALHLYFFYLESFAWRRVANKVFGVPKEHVEITAVLASNQGLYNALIAGGLVLGAVWYQPGLAYAFRVYFLGAVIMAGIWGGITASPRILWIQAAPAAVALLITLLSAP